MTNTPERVRTAGPEPVGPTERRIHCTARMETRDAAGRTAGCGTKPVSPICRRDGQKAPFWSPTSTSLRGLRNWCL